MLPLSCSSGLLHGDTAMFWALIGGGRSLSFIRREGSGRDTAVFWTLIGGGRSLSFIRREGSGGEGRTCNRTCWTVVRSGMALGRLQYVQALYRTYCTMCSVPELWSFWRGLGRTYCRTCSVDRGPVWHGLRQSSVCASPGQHLRWNLLWGLWSCLAWPWADFSMCNTWAQLTVELALGTMILSGMALGRLQYVQYLGTTYCGTCSGDCGPVSQGQTSVCAILGLNLQ